MKVIPIFVGDGLAIAYFDVGLDSGSVTVGKSLLTTIETNFMVSKLFSTVF
jgi:hypothetical protein